MIKIPADSYKTDEYTMLIDEKGAELGVIKPLQEVLLPAAEFKVTAYARLTSSKGVISLEPGKLYKLEAPKRRKRKVVKNETA